MNLQFVAAVTVLALCHSGVAAAACRCACVNGEMQALCSSSIDIEPICPPTVCAITPPSVAPIQVPRVPPIGTSDCSPQQIYNEYSRRYEWREVCY